MHSREPLRRETFKDLPASYRGLLLGSIGGTLSLSFSIFDPARGGKAGEDWTGVLLYQRKEARKRACPSGEGFSFSLGLIGWLAG